MTRAGAPTGLERGRAADVRNDVRNDVPTTARLPRWLQPVNRVIVWLQRRGIAFFTFHLLTVPGRKSGRLYTTPVSPLFLAGACYIVSIGQTEWVKNARAAGWGELARGRRRWKVRLVELGLDERKPLVRAFPVQVPRGVPFLVRVGAVTEPGDADAFEAAAAKLAVFRADPIPGAAAATPDAAPKRTR